MTLQEDELNIACGDVVSVNGNNHHSRSLCRSRKSIRSRPSGKTMGRLIHISYHHDTINILGFPGRAGQHG